MDNSLKMIAVVSMLIDHIGAVFFPKIALFRIIGRLAYPIFAYKIAKGYEYSKNVYRYGARLLLFGIISQWPYDYLFSSYNVYFTLLAGLASIYIYDKHSHYVAYLFAILTFLIPEMDYAGYGALIILLFYVFKEKKTQLVLSVSVVILLMSIEMSLYIPLYALLAFPFIFADNLPSIHVNKYFYYAFYPAHLAVICLYCSQLKT